MEKVATILTPELITQAKQLTAQNPKLEGFVAGEGSLTPKFVLVSEAPGRTEIKLGHPFQGPAGKELNEWCQQLGVSRDEIYIAAAVKSRPFNEKKGFKRDRKPTPAEIEAFAPFFDFEIAHLDCDLLVPMGNTGLERLLGRGQKIGEVHGQFLHHAILEWDVKHQQWHFSDREYTIFPTYHPSYSKRFKKMRPVVDADLKKLRAYLSGEPD
ncbi:uracil-DNA glycosylase [Levilactobacillus bambusae]|uniref:Uracil-DNA glycosylase n=1 Tax=Levilactobacillus bambusae TaxID=2024736 RepID=A0A2V1N193_9LACO|nr:uracil-DNA glycosylase [Levilactobacillus bambusae]PWG00146.1 uracil-DNA glycosylase [Levilactobacillus bambusae]